MTVRIIAEKCQGKDLKPGDLFSTAGPEYWDLFPAFAGVGERVYIRTNTPTPDGQADAEVYRIRVVAVDQSQCPHQWHYYGTVNGVPDVGCQLCGATRPPEEATSEQPAGPSSGE